MKYSIHGTLLPCLNIELHKKEEIYSQSGGMCWKSPNVNMQTTGKGGAVKSVKRWFSGESFFLTTFRCTKGTGMVSFGSQSPGTIVAIKLKKGKEYICQKEAFLCAEKSVDLDIHFRKRLGRGFFGGEGFVLQRLSGKGHAFINIDGELCEYNLAKGEVLQVDTGHIAMYEPSVDYDIQRIRGFSNIFFGREGIFLATLRGPGKVWLQTLPLRKLAQRLRRQFIVDKMKIG